MVPGTINFAGVREVLFSPDSGSWLKSFVGSGPRVTAHACQQCGHLSLEVSALALNTHLNDDRFRCRRCEHMLRDPAAANCDRCGETI